MEDCVSFAKQRDLETYDAVHVKGNGTFTETILQFVVLALNHLLHKPGSQEAFIVSFHSWNCSSPCV